MDRHIKHALEIHASLYSRGSAICTFMRFSARQAALGVGNIGSQWVIAVWADGVCWFWERAWILGEGRMEEVCCDWVPVPEGAWGVPGCVPEESDAIVFVCVCVCMWHASRHEQ